MAETVVVAIATAPAPDQAQRLHRAHVVSALVQMVREAAPAVWRVPQAEVGRRGRRDPARLDRLPRHGTERVRAHLIHEEPRGVVHDGAQPFPLGPTLLIGAFFGLVEHG